MKNPETGNIVHKILHEGKQKHTTQKRKKPGPPKKLDKKIKGKGGT